MKARRPLTAALLFAFAAAGLAFAADQPPRVVLSVDVREEITRLDAQGNIEVLHRQVERADPGDVLIYTLTYTNVGARPAVNAKVDDPIPAGTVLLPESVQGAKASITFSADGGRTYTSYPAKVVTPGPDGKPLEMEAPAEKYTHVRWNAVEPLAPGESRTASFKVVVR